MTLGAVIARRKILELEAALRDSGEGIGPEAFVTRHHYAPGSYGREIELPAGSLVVGKIHRHAHINVISKGHVIVATQSGVKEIAAPATFVSEPGTKRAVYAIADTVWTTIHVTNETDLAKIEAELIAPNYAALEQGAHL